MTLKDLMQKNRKNEHLLKQDFTRCFNKNIKEYMDPFTGFDLVKFDDDIETPDGVSLEEHIQKTYGEEANQLIFKLIS